MDERKGEDEWCGEMEGWGCGRSDVVSEFLLLMFKESVAVEEATPKLPVRN